MFSGTLDRATNTPVCWLTGNPNRLAAGAGRGPAVPVDVAGRAPAAAAEGRVVGADRPPAGPGGPVEHVHPRAAAGPGPGDDLRPAVPVEVGGRHVHPGGHARVVGVER